jgi:hypothetical protein
MRLTLHPLTTHHSPPTIPTTTTTTTLTLTPGKSTLASLLADRLGIHSVISTYHIRQMLRDRSSPADSPHLFVSTYEAAQTVKTQTKQT